MVLYTNCPAKKGPVKQRFGEIIPFDTARLCICRRTALHSALSRSCLCSRFQLKVLVLLEAKLDFVHSRFFIFHSIHSYIQCLCTDKMCICLYPPQKAFVIKLWKKFFYSVSELEIMSSCGRKQTLWFRFGWE